MSVLDLEKINICGVHIDNVIFSEAVQLFIMLAKDKDNHHIVVTPNVDHIIKLQTDKDFQDVYKSASLVFADGVPLIWASRYLKTPLKEKISGSDIFPEICCAAAKEGLKVFFLGGQPGAADAAKTELSRKNPKLNVCGTYCPPFGFEKDSQENQKIIKAINTAKPDILFIGLGAPKQEIWAAKWKDELFPSVSIGIGASFNFTAGLVKRAPLWAQRIGLEWFWRFLMEPKRLFRRYFIEDMAFFRLIWKQKREIKSTYIQ